MVQGEYVDFSLSDTKTQDHEFQAGEVCGIKGGKLMCETRRDSRVARSQYRTSRTESSEPVKMPRSVSTPDEQKRQRPPRVRGQGPREESADWTYVAKARNGSETGTQTQTQRASSGRGRGRPPRAGRGEGKTQSS